MRLGERIVHGWNAFTGRNLEPELPGRGMGISGGGRPERITRSYQSTKRLIAPIINQIAIDTSGVEFRHVRVNEDGAYSDDIKSYLNECLSTEPNLDQSPAQFRLDIAATMMEEGHAAIVPVKTTVNPTTSGGYDIHELRVGVVTDWFPRHVRVELYNEKTGFREEVIVPKAMTALPVNPLFDIMNSPNSTLQRLIHKLNQLDITDDRLTSGKLDIILQLPYTIKHDTRRDEANKRVGALEDQLKGSAYGIGYIDGSERITQLNRPSENNLLEQVKLLEVRIRNELGLTEEVFMGTADESAMINYQNRTVFPIARAVQEEMRRKFLTKTARTRGQSILFFRDPFDLVPVSQVAEIADKFTRNEIMSPNEFRPIVGLRPVKDPEADELRNRNMPKVDTDVNKEEPSSAGAPAGEEVPPEEQEGKTLDEAQLQRLRDEVRRTMLGRKDDQT